MLDCSTCLANVDPALRREMGCGWLAPIDSPSSIWQHQGDERAEGDEPTVCAGFTSELPDVIDTARSWGHWEKGSLALRVVDPPRALLDGIEILNGAIEGLRSHHAKPRKDG